MRSRISSFAVGSLRAALLLAAVSLVLPDRAEAQSPTLVVSTSPNRSSPVPLSGATVADDIFVFTTPDTGVLRVRFWIDQPAMTGTPFRTENTAPFDLAGGSVATATAYDSSDLSEGSHTISARLDLTAGGSIDLHATFTVANDVPSLAFSPVTSSVNLAPGATGTASATVTSSNGAGVTPTLSESATWLTLSTGGSTTPLSVTLNFNSAGLAAGTYTTSVTATATGHTAASLPVTLVVGAPSAGYQLLNSASANRASPAPLAGQVTSGNIHVFTSPSTGVTRVRFYLDDPAFAGTPFRTENTAPHDFNGGSVSLATPFDTEDISDGAHTISARIDLSAGGTEVLHGNFTVANGAALLDFLPEDLSISLDIGVQQQIPIDLVTSSGAPASFSLSESAPWLSLSPGSGATPATIQLTIDTSGLAYGSYSAQIQASAPGYLPATFPIDLVVAPGIPRQVHITWVDDPSTTLTVTWQTSTSAAPSQVEYRVAGGSTWSVATGSLRTSGTSGQLHEATLSGLLPGTVYEYRVPGDSAWSEVFTARTAPPLGPADFDFVYYADTGIAGRLDGLTTGTAQCIDEIAEIDPLLVLAGGDYAYFNTDTRFPTLDDAIDAWFEQMEPVTTGASMMPTYGNHEVFLSEGFAPWAARFPTPNGFDGRRCYSFDVGDVHFISVFAAEDLGGLRPGTIDWLDDDMTAAEAAGARWIIPFMHVAPFSDGGNHPSSTVLRAQLGPLFEAHDVKIVLTAHDQSYERTYPLVGVPSTISATSSSLGCYDSSEGITWIKVGPAGKLSNKNGNFSQWLTVPPPSWTAFRHNTLHHFAHVTVSAAGTLDVEIWGVVGDGSPPVVVDTFRYTLSSCPAELQFSDPELDFDVVEGDFETQGLAISASNSSAIPFALESSASWLSVTPTSGSTPANLTVTADTDGLAAGSYTGTITATAAGLLPITAIVTLDVTPEGFVLMVSGSPQRTGAVPLEGAVVADDIFVFTTPDIGVTQVRFYIDDPNRSGPPFRTENTAPFDLAGGSAAAASPYDSTDLSDGLHTITAAVVHSGGQTAVIHGDFFVANSTPALVVLPTSLALSAAADGAPAGGSVQVTTSGPLATFTVAIPPGDTWLSASAPGGTTPATLGLTADPAGLPPGGRSSTVTISSPGFAPANVSVTFQVIDDSPILSWGAPSLSFSEAEGGSTPPDQGVELTALPGTADVVIDVPPTATWLAVDPEGGETPLQVSFGADATNLPVGTYTATVTASAAGFASASIVVTFTVEPAYRVMVSFDPERTNPQSLQGMIVAGDIYVFSVPEDPTIDFVEFWVDDPGMVEFRYRLEGNPPYDIEGGDNNGDARPFDTTELDDGEHTITAKSTFLDGSSIVAHAVFNILNDAPALHFPGGELVIQLDPGETLSTSVAVATTNATVTSFSLDPVAEGWLAATVTDSTTPGSLQVEIDTAGLSGGLHLGSARVTAPGYSPGTLDVRLTVGVPGLGYFAGDDVIDTAVSIVGDDWYINGQVTYPGRVWVNPANGQSRVIEGLLMNSRSVQGVYDDLDGSIPTSMVPWDPEANTQDFIDNLPIWRDHGLLAFNVGFQGGGNPGAASSEVDCNPFGSDGRRCFDDWYAGLETPYSNYLVRMGSIIRAADDLGMVVEVSPFYWGQDQRLADNDAVLAAMDGVLDWILENGWTNVIIEVANEASYQPNGVFAFNHSLLQTTGSVDLMEHVIDYTNGPEGAHLPHGRLLTSVSGHGGYVPNDAWIGTADYVIWHGNGQSASGTASRLDMILARAVYQADPKPIYTNEQNADLLTIDPHLARHASWGYHGRNQYQRVYPTTDTTRWTISKDPAWWSKLAEITGSTP